MKFAEKSLNLFVHSLPYSAINKQQNKITTMKSSWEKSIYVIFVPIYILSLYLAIKFPEDGVWPFIMLNIGALTGVPNLIRLFKKEKPEAETPSEPTKGRKYWKYLLAYISASLLISLAIDMFLDKEDKIAYIGVFVIFASIFVALLIVDLFLVVIPKLKAAKEAKELPQDTNNTDNE